MKQQRLQARWMPNTRPYFYEISKGTGNRVFFIGEVGTSSTPAFLAAARPRLALFQVGYRNRYRHPKPEVIERYEQFGIERLRTDESGAIMLDSASGFVPVEYRREHPRYW